MSTTRAITPSTRASKRRQTAQNDAIDVHARAQRREPVLVVVVLEEVDRLDERRAGHPALGARERATSIASSVRAHAGGGRAAARA